MIFKSLMFSDDGSDISHLSYSGGRNMLLAFSDTGDAYSIDEIPDNAYGYGDVNVYASILDGLGWEWSVQPSSVNLLLSDGVLDVSESSYEEIFSGVAYGTGSKAVAEATYISDVLSVGDEFGYWKDISWTQDFNLGRVVIALKVGETAEEVIGKDWEYYYESPASYGSYPSGTFASFDLDRFNLKGRHMMFKVEMEVTAVSGYASVMDFRIAYVTRHSVFFFTNSIKIESEGFDNMIVTASQTLPVRTEVAFGVGPANSSNWNDYIPVDLDRIESVPSSFGSRSKVGIRLTSFDLSAYPTVHEFALEFGADSDNKINQEGLE